MSLLFNVKFWGVTLLPKYPRTCTQPHSYFTHAIRGCWTLLPKFPGTCNGHHLFLAHALWGGCRVDDIRMESKWMFNAPLASLVNSYDSPSKILRDFSHLFLIHAIQGCGTHLPKFVWTHTWHHWFLTHALWGGCRADNIRMESWWMFNAPLLSPVNYNCNYSLIKISQWSIIFCNRFLFQCECLI